MSGASPVSLEREGNIGVITVNYPSVNALGPGVAEGIKECVAHANTNPAIKAVVLIGAGRSFIAGGRHPRHWHEPSPATGGPARL